MKPYISFITCSRNDDYLDTLIVDRMNPSLGILTYFWLSYQLTWVE